MGSAPPTVVLVHGAWHSPWHWHRVVTALEERGVPAVAVDLPSCGTSRADMYADATAIRHELDEHSDVVLVAHSYGGIPATQAAAAHPSVRHLVYLAAYMADLGETLMGFAPPEPGPGAVYPPRDLEFGEDGLMSVRPDRAVDLFYNDCEPADAVRAVRHLRPMSAQVTGQAPTSIAWKDVPSTYIVCKNDRATSVALQQQLRARAKKWVELDSGHSAFISQPRRLAGLIPHSPRPAGVTSC